MASATIEIANSTMPAIFQPRCVFLNSSMLAHLLFCHAHSLPLKPRTKAQAKPKTGMRQSKDIRTPLQTPHIQVKTNAPQLQPLISSGTTADSPCPDVLYGATPTLSFCPQLGQNSKPSVISFPHLVQNGIAPSHILLMYHMGFTDKGQCDRRRTCGDYAKPVHYNCRNKS